MFTQQKKQVVIERCQWGLNWLIDLFMRLTQVFFFYFSGLGANENEKSFEDCQGKHARKKWLSENDITKMLNEWND